MLQEPFTAVCCFGSMLWKLKMKLCVIMPGAVQMHVSPSLEETIVKKCNRYQQIFLIFFFNSCCFFHLLYQCTLYGVFFSVLSFSLSAYAAVDHILQFMVVAICSLCSFFLTLFDDRVNQFICCSSVIYLQSLLSNQMTMQWSFS